MTWEKVICKKTVWPPNLYAKNYSFSSSDVTTNLLSLRETQLLDCLDCSAVHNDLRICGKLAHKADKGTSLLWMILPRGLSLNGDDKTASFLFFQVRDKKWSNWDSRLRTWPMSMCSTIFMVNEICLVIVSKILIKI